VSSSRSFLKIGVLVILLAMPTWVISRAQSSGASGPVLTADVNVVSLYCTVYDKENRLVNSLTKDDFDLDEDGRPQTIKYFSRETDVPLTIGLLVDVSGSQQKLIGIERQAAAQFFPDVMREKDLAFLISFGADVELLQDLTGSPHLLQLALERLKLSNYASLSPGKPATQRGTVLYDGLHFAAHDILAKEKGRRAIILITDGEDNGSSLRMKDAVEAAQKSDSIVYGILYVDRAAYSFPRLLPGGGTIGYTGDTILRQIAGETGGRVFTVDAKNPLAAIFEQIQEELRAQYLIGYTSTNLRNDGGFRKIELRTRDKELRVDVRKGYYALPAAQ
jgi:VWFA-related protein